MAEVASLACSDMERERALPVSQHRMFATSRVVKGNEDIDWEDLTKLPSDDVEAFAKLVASSYPNKVVVEAVLRGSGDKVPATLVLETTLPKSLVDSQGDIISLTREVLEPLIEIASEEVYKQLPVLSQARKDDVGFRFSYCWDASLRTLKLHFVAPNTYVVNSDHSSAALKIHIRKPHLNSAYVGSFMQETIVSGRVALPIYMGPNYIVVSGDRETFYVKATPATFSYVQNSKQDMVLPSQAAGGAFVAHVANPQSQVADLDAILVESFGKLQYHEVPTPERVRFFKRMIEASAGDRYNDFICDVAYHMCGTMGGSARDMMEGRPQRFNSQPRTLRMLQWVARRENPSAYMLWMLEQSSVMAHSFMTESETDAIFHRIICMSLEGSFVSQVLNTESISATPVVFYFDNVWNLDGGFSRLSEAVERAVTKFIGNVVKGYLENRGQAMEATSFVSECMRLNYMTTMRGNTLKGIARMLIENFSFDKDPYVIGCRNVVIELTNTKAIARPGRPEDLISMSTGLSYREFTPAECNRVNVWFDQMFGIGEAEDSLRNWMMRLTCGLLEGMNSERWYYVLFGCARNGKSAFLDGLERVFGEYYRRTSAKAFAERNDPSATSPELAGMIGARVITCSELAPGVEMQSAILKAVVGGDGVSVRALYKAPEKLVLGGRIFFATNHMIIFAHPDKAIRDRTRLVPMDSVFDVGAPSTEDEQRRARFYPAVGDFKRVLDELAPIMLYMMVRGYEDYKRIGLQNIPACMRTLEDAYWADQNIPGNFVDTCLEFTNPLREGEGTSGDARPTAAAALPAASGIISRLKVPSQQGDKRLSKVTVAEAYETFAEWAALQAVDLARFPLRTFKSLVGNELMTRRGFRIETVSDGWIGVRLRVV